MPLLHFLNPVPIQLIHDRWVSKYTRPRATALLDLKAALEEKRENMNSTTATKPQQVYQVYIKATPEQVWEGITNPAFTSLYFYGTHVKSTLKEGTPFNYYGDDPTSPMVEGKVLESDPPRRLVHTWRMLYNPELAGAIGNGQQLLEPSDAGTLGRRDSDDVEAFLEGTKTIAFELFEALGTALHDVVTPVGQGTVLIGLAMGFGELVSAGLLERAPRLHGIQSEACAPLVRGAPIGRAAPVVRQPSIADGIRIPEPTRMERSYAAVRYSGGRWLAVSEDAIEHTWRGAAARGLLMEPTSAAALAGARALNLPAGTVVIITGSGLKAVERY